MRRLVASGWLLLVAGVAPAASSPQYDSPEGGFAFTPPPGWETKVEEGEAFPTLSGPKDDLRSPYVVIQTITDKRELLTFGDVAVKEKLKDAHFQLSKRDAFQTADKEFGVKFVFSFTLQGPTPAMTLAYKQAYYLVQGPPGIIYGILATVPESGWEKFQPILDEMMKTYHRRPVVAAPKAAPAATASEKSTAQAKSTDNH